MIRKVNDLIQQERYSLVTNAVVPRPIAWISSMNQLGVLNLAPFSDFTIGALQPMTLLFSIDLPYRTGKIKDTLRNIQEVPEFVINIPNEDTLDAMNMTATELAPSESEFEWASVTAVPSETIRVPRVGEAPIAFECTVQRIVQISDKPGGGSVIFGEVQCVYVRDDLYEDGKITLQSLKPIGRLGSHFYTLHLDALEVGLVPPPPDRAR